jgi:cobaltochelatase CobT
MDKMSMNLSNNADGENIMYAYARLKNQPQQRKILIVLSDGEPSAQGPAGCTMGIGQFTKETIEMIEKDKSVHIIGLGMSGYSPKRFYKHAYEVKAKQPLEQVLLDIVKNSVLK